MYTALCIAVILGTIAMFWTQSAWTAMIALVNVFIAALLATNFFEPVADYLETGLGMGEYTYLLDFLAVYGIFLFSIGILRLITDFLSRTSVRFLKPVEIAGKVIFGAWTGWIFVCFMSFTVHLAPLDPSPFFGGFASSPYSGNFFQSDDQWLGYMQWASQGPLARSNHSGFTNELDEAFNSEVFDPKAEIPIKYYHRRVEIEKQGFRVRR